MSEQSTGAIRVIDDSGRDWVYLATGMALAEAGTKRSITRELTGMAKRGHDVLIIEMPAGAVRTWELRELADRIERHWAELSGAQQLTLDDES